MTRVTDAQRPTLPSTELTTPHIGRRRLSWWIWGIVGVIVVAGAIDFMVTTPGWQWNVVGAYIFDPEILSGVFYTIWLTVLSAVCGLIAGGVVAVLRMSENPALRAAGTVFVWLMRAIPALVVLLFVFFLGALVPELTLGIPYTDVTLISVKTNDVITKFTAALIGLTLIQAAHVGEIYRGGILSVSKGQHEAGGAIGMTRAQSMRRIIMPQAIRVIIPPLSNELITLFKNTSLVSVIGFTELLTSVQLVYGRTYQTIPMLLVACLWYLFLTSIAMLGQSALEKHFSRGFVRRSKVQSLEEPA
ncbi:amino acid ABC transporter permease [Microbacterium sp. MPKO10]|uniref:amino acid ABC transporter permease n=1 Tax=Microbacterium sp. MPKO10 TaxID=2989818 RepID=UPI0022366995|nr:amino acid ABC transporter permease [Microbacterium sp. MPKO10]MCW4458645.1 amino acid ABC transporter permease [Microbacterium sp. MPKO10]